MKRVLLTGVAGFIGAHTLEHLLENTDWEIIGIDSLKHRGKQERIDQVMAKNPDWQSRFEFIICDLAGYDYPQLDLMSIFKGSSLTDKPIDYIINMAAESHVDRSITDPVPFVKNNIDLVLTMLEWARLMKPEMFIQISTDEVYGPMENGRPYAEWERHLPSNPYSASKSAQEAIAISYWRTYGVPLVITNTMNNIGEMQDPEKFVPLVIKKLLAGEEISIHGSEHDMGSRFYLHARNHADALLFILKNMPAALHSAKTLYPDRYHIVGDTRVGNLDMAGKIAQLIPAGLYYKFDSSIRPGHDLHYGLSDGKLHAAGWRPPLSFEESLARTVENYLEHREWLN